MRATEYALLLVPVAIGVAWLCGVRGLSRRGIVAVLAGFATLAACLVWLGAERGFTGHYVPARFDGTRIEPGHKG